MPIVSELDFSSLQYVKHPIIHPIYFIFTLASQNQILLGPTKKHVTNVTV